jgi:rod shape-determining protein MreC
VGQVTRDQHFTAEVIMITDPDHALPVQILRTQQRTVALGTGDLDSLSLPFLPRAADIRSGDMIVTSGLGGTFPPGYPVGTVTASSAAPGAEFKDVRASPTARLDRVREVLFIWSGENAAAAVEEETP